MARPLKVGRLQSTCIHQVAFAQTILKKEMSGEKTKFEENGHCSQMNLQYCLIYNFNNLIKHFIKMHLHITQLKKLIFFT